MEALNSRGGYGTFQSNNKKRDYFHRGLLWQRSGATLKRIKFHPNDKVPTWSWMAFHGGIRYMNVPFLDIEKAKDIVSPFQDIKPGILYTDMKFEKPAELHAPIRTLIVDTAGSIIWDDPNRKLARPLKCIIIGKSVKERVDGQRTHYAMIVSFIGVEEGVEIYERAGVAYLVTEEIESEGDKKYVRIR
jgi:hypothetical protein